MRPTLVHAASGIRIPAVYSWPVGGETTDGHEGDAIPAGDAPAKSSSFIEWASARRGQQRPSREQHDNYWAGLMLFFLGSPWEFDTRTRSGLAIEMSCSRAWLVLPWLAFPELPAIITINCCPKQGTE